MTNGTSRIILAAAILAGAASLAGAATVDELLTAADSRALTAAECGQLSDAMKDTASSAKWLNIAKALKKNWDVGQITAWQQVAKVKEIASDLSAEQKPLMSAALLELYAVQGPVLKQLDAGEGEELINVLLGLGEQAKASELLAGWMTVTDAWKTKANADQLPKLAAAMRFATSELAGQQRTALAGQAWTKYLTAEAPDRSKATWPQVIHMVYVFTDLLSGEQKRDLGPRLIGWMKDTNVASTLKVDAVRVLEAVLPKYDVSNEYAEIAATWVSASESWKNIGEEDIITLGPAVGSSKSQLARQQSSKLPGLFMEKYFAASAAELPLPKAVYLARRMFPALSSEQRVQVVQKLSPRASQTQDGAVLTELAVLMQDAGRVGGAEGVADFASVLAAALKGGIDFSTRNNFHHFATAFGTAETQKLLRDDLLDANGLPRLNLTTTLAFAYRNEGHSKEWLDFLDGKINEQGVSADAKAMWMIAKAHAQLIGPSSKDGPIPNVKNRAACYQTLQAALGVASSQKVKRQMLEELARNYVSVNQHVAAITMLESVKDQFAGDELGKLNQLIEAVKQSKAAYEQAETARQALDRETQRKGLLRIYLSRLAVAQQQNDQTAVDELRKAIAALDKK